MEHVLDWKPNHDPKSWGHLVQLPRTASTRSARLWLLRNPVLDQGSEGACVGHGVINACSAPHMGVRLPHPQCTAFGMYYGSRRIDEWPGERYDGTSVNAGCKLAVELGFASGWKWAMGVEAVARTVLDVAPVVVGVPWTEGMHRPDPKGVIRATGEESGGHCVCVRGYSSLTKLFRIRQSWGADHGLLGDVLISYADLGMLLERDGEAAILLA